MPPAPQPHTHRPSPSPTPPLEPPAPSRGPLGEGRPNVRPKVRPNVRQKYAQMYAQILKCIESYLEGTSECPGVKGGAQIRDFCFWLRFSGCFQSLRSAPLSHPIVAPVVSLYPPTCSPPCFRTCVAREVRQGLVFWACPIIVNEWHMQRFVLVLSSRQLYSGLRR